MANARLGKQMIFKDYGSINAVVTPLAWRGMGACYYI